MNLISETTPRARKRHRCDWCDGAILPGETYRRQACADGGTAWTWRAHPECDRAADEVVGRDDDVSPGALSDGRYPDDQLPAWWLAWRASRGTP